MSYHSQLTQREAEILSLVAVGKRNAEIALALNITIHTVETHLGNIYSKLALRTRTEAAHWYWQHRQSLNRASDTRHA